MPTHIFFTKPLAYKSPNWCEQQGRKKKILMLSPGELLKHCSAVFNIRGAAILARPIHTPINH